MVHRCLYPLVVLSLLALGGCPRRDEDSSLENPLEARPWTQMHGNAENSGFNAVHTTFALRPLKKWSAAVGELAFSGPVVGPDGSIYVGNVAGEVVALNPDGTERWRRKVDDSILTSPVVDAATGDIFVIGQRPDDETRITSRLYRLNASAGLLATSQTAFVSAAPPKLWRDFIFVSAGLEVLVFGRDSLNLVGQKRIGCIDLVCGDPPVVSFFAAGFANLLGCMVTLGLSEVIGLTDCVVEFEPPSGPSLIPPAVAVVDAPGLAGDSGRPLLVITTNQCVSVHRFHPAGDAPVSGANDPHFQGLWGHPLVEVDCDFDRIEATAAGVVLGGQVLVGDEDGRVLSLDLLTGRELWSRDVGEAVMSTPVTALRQIYVVTRDTMVMLDSDGDPLSESPLRGLGQGAALSLDFAYVTTDEGVHTFALDPAEGFAFDGSIVSSTHVGFAIPALGEDGTLYVSTPAGFVHAYAPSGFLQREVAIPRVAWTTPGTGETLAYVAGQPLAVELRGAGGSDFAGTVTLVSDRDGVLCELAAVGAVAECTTNRELSLGTHVLTAFATDESGGTNTATITVQVVSAPPAVTLREPAEGAAFLEHEPIRFVAEVSDPDQARFAGENVHWSSDIAGALGTGLELERTLLSGDHVITAVAVDERGVSAEARVRIRVGPNTAPTVRITSPRDDTTTSDLDTIVFAAEVADPDEPDFPPDRVRWRSDLVGDLGTGFALERKLPVGAHTITVTATDEAGAARSAVVRIRVFLN